MAYTLADLRTLVLQRADMENSTRISTAELTNYINDSMEELYDLVTQAYGPSYFMANATPTTTASNNTMAFGVAVYKLIGMRVVLNGKAYPMRRLSWGDFVYDSTAQAWTEGMDIGYLLKSDGVLLQPVPNAVYTVSVEYIPTVTRLSAAGDSFPSALFGWAEYVVVDAAIKCMEKDQRDTTQLSAHLARLAQRITSASQSFDEYEPSVTVDVQGGYSDAWWG